MFKNVFYSLFEKRKTVDEVGVDEMNYNKNAFKWIWCLPINFQIMVSSVLGVFVQGGKMVWCLLPRVAKNMWCLLFTLAKIAWCLLTLVSFVLHS